MKIRFGWCWAAFALALAPVGCGKSADQAKQTAELEKDLHSLAAAQSVFGQHVDRAITAVRSNDYVAAVSVLESAKWLPQAGPEQRLAIQEAIRTLTRQLTERAVQGDEKALADLSAIEKQMNR